MESSRRPAARRHVADHPRYVSFRYATLSRYAGRLERALSMGTCMRSSGDGRLIGLLRLIRLSWLFWASPAPAEVDDRPGVVDGYQRGPAPFGPRTCAGARWARSVHAAAASPNCTAALTDSAAFCQRVRSRHRRWPRMFRLIRRSCGGRRDVPRAERPMLPRRLVLTAAGWAGQSRCARSRIGLTGRVAEVDLPQARGGFAAVAAAPGCA